MRKKVYYHVNIPFKRGQDMDKIFDLEHDLGDSGITFDTGSDFKSRDWELDWSLRGAKPIKIINLLKKNKIKFTKSRVD